MAFVRSINRCGFVIGVKRECEKQVIKTLHHKKGEKRKEERMNKIKRKGEGSWNLKRKR